MAPHKPETTQQHNTSVKKLYDVTTKDYIEAWSNSDDLGMHLGLWEPKTKNRHESIRNENQFVAHVLGIKPGDVVLDAGCGIGGTSIYVAKLGATVYGVTLSDIQVKIASESALKKEAKAAFFECQDFTKTRFPNKFFDHVIAIESSCNSDRGDFISEANRVLKDGGKLLIVDYYRSEKKMGLIQRLFVKFFIWGWELTPSILERASLIKYHTIRAGFSSVKTCNGTVSMLPSSLLLFVMCIMALLSDILNAAIRRQHFIIELKNTIASIMQYFLFRKGFLKYVISIAKK